jgi:hypothetical protein
MFSGGRFIGGPDFMARVLGALQRWYLEAVVSRESDEWLSWV